MNEPNKIKSIRNNIILLGIVSFLNDLSSEMIMPILPMFITALGGTGLAVGLIGGVRDSVSSILKIFGGHWSDKTNKKKSFVLSGYLSSAVFKLLLAFSQIWQHVLVFTGLERVGKGLRTAPRDAIISASASKEKRGKGFGIHRTLDTLGAISGSVVVFFLIWNWGLEFKTIILIAGVIAFTSIIPLRFVTEKKKETKKESSLKISLRLLPSHLKLFILIAGIFAMANFSYMFFILRAKGVFTQLSKGLLSGMPKKSSIGIPILLYILFNIFYASFSTPLGALSDKIGRKKVILLGYFLFFLISLGFAFLPEVTTGLPLLFSFIILFALYGVVFAGIDGNQRAFVSDLAGEEYKATALGTFHAVVGLAVLPGSFIAGILWQFSPLLTFLYGSIVSTVSIILFVNFRHTT